MSSACTCSKVYSKNDLHVKNVHVHVGTLLLLIHTKAGLFRGLNFCESQ